MANAADPAVQRAIGPGELAPQERIALKSQLQFEPAMSSYTWSYPKRDPTYGNDILQLQNRRAIVGLAPQLQKLITQPWSSLAVKNLPSSSGATEMIDFGKLPIFRIYVADADQISLYHETSFVAVDKIVNLTSDVVANGTLNSTDIRFTNQNMNAAFYTHIDPGNSLELGLPNHDALLGIKTQPNKDMLILELYEPIDPNQISQALAILTGDKHYWENYQKMMNLSPPYNFDLYQNAVVTALREIHKVPVDMMIYVKDYEVHTMGPATRNVFSWAILFNREILENASVPKIFDDSLALSLLTNGIGVDESKYDPFNLKTLQLYISNPGLRTMIANAMGPGTISQNSQIAQRVNALPDPMSFWSNVYGPFQKDFFSLKATSLEDLESSLGGKVIDSAYVNNFIIQRLLSFWDQFQGQLDIRPQTQTPAQSSSCQDLFFSLK